MTATAEAGASQNQAPPSVTEVSIEQLFGKFSYRIDVGPREPLNAANATGELVTVRENRLTLLYGRNGSGKTTLLRTLFHALSPSDDRGHRSALFATPFLALDITLSDGTRISYRRDRDSPVGPYVAEVDRPSWGKAISWHYDDAAYRGLRTTYGGRIYMQTGTQMTFEGSNPEGFVLEEDDEARFLRALRELAIVPVFLGDSRAIVSDALDRDDLRAIEDQQRARTIDDLVRATRNVDVRDALDRVRRYLSQLAFTGTQEGSQRVDTVYLNVATAIVQAASTIGRPRKAILPDLVSALHGVGSRAQRFNEYGLLPEFPVATLAEALKEAPDKQGPLLRRVLEPYLQGLEERMDALDPGLRAVASFVDALNSFLEGKRAEFRPSREGIRILDESTGQPLDPTVLSSGEKQVVLMFSDITALQGQARLFIIDEPELSLNPDWQRALMPRLLEVTEQSGMQLIAATHSIEIMARYKGRIRRLDT
jgi:energy-coupling factor transporter ATP-binding protein EcfA2